MMKKTTVFAILLLIFIRVSAQPFPDSQNGESYLTVNDAKCGW
jgi:hypothetical protein